METNQAEQFHIHNYPKSHGSLNNWRLRDYLHLHPEEQHQVYKQLEQFCLLHVQTAQPIKQYQNYIHLGSGWEWSVFATDQDTVIKVPAGVFSEVNDPQYLANAKHAYQIISQYYPQRMVAETNFSRHQETNIVEQVRLQGQDWNIIDFQTNNQWLLHELEIFFECTAALIQEQHWLPDFWLDYDPAGFALRNIMIDSTIQQFAIIDFTSYLDPARMYPALCEHHCQKNSARTEQMLRETKQALANLKA